jgi:hypothetical protein
MFSIKRSFLLFLAASPLLLQAEAVHEACSQEILFSYFPKPFVDKVLKKHQVPESQWGKITEELNEKDKLVVQRVEEKAQSMEPNPLKDPKMRHEAVRIFRETLMEYFGSVLKNHGVKDQEQIQEMLDEMQQMKARYFVECMEKLTPEENTPAKIESKTLPLNSPLEQ